MERRLKLFVVILGMLMIWYYAQMLVYVEVMIILERLSERFQTFYNKVTEHRLPLYSNIDKLMHNP